MITVAQTLRNYCMGGPGCKCTLNEAANLIESQQARIADLERQLSESQAREEKLLNFVRNIASQTPGKPDYWSSCSQCEQNSSDAGDLLNERGAA